MTTHSKIPRMANQIATFFESQPADEQVAGVADHINSNWAPRMRLQLFELLDEKPAEFHPLVVEAAGSIRRPAEV